jgi:hypothetical protein
MPLLNIIAGLFGDNIAFGIFPLLIGILPIIIGVAGDRLGVVGINCFRLGVDCGDGVDWKHFTSVDPTRLGVVGNPDVLTILGNGIPIILGVLGVFGK